MTVWAFNDTKDAMTTRKIYESILNGKSRFGWSDKDGHNLLLKDNWTDYHSRQLFLLQIERDDWIVHINTPNWGRCTAARVIALYNFDGGLQLEGRSDFRHFFEIDKESIVEFDRNNPNVLPTVNLNPRYRYHRVYAESDFLQSIENIEHNKVVLSKGETREEYHLKEKTSGYLSELTQLIQKMNKSKKLERFLAEVFNPTYS